jgi:hypothetical protein
MEKFTSILCLFVVCTVPGYRLKSLQNKERSLLTPENKKEKSRILYSIAVAWRGRGSETRFHHLHLAVPCAVGLILIRFISHSKRQKGNTSTISSLVYTSCQT